MTARSTALSLVLGVVLATGVAHAQPEVDQQVNAIFNTWQQAAAAAKASGQAIEARLSSRIQEQLPVIDSSPRSKNYPLFTPHRKPIAGENGLNGGNFTRIRNFAKKFTGPATLAVTADGQLATRSYKGHDWGKFTYVKNSRMIISSLNGEPVKRSTKLGYSKVKPLVPRFIAKMFPKTAQRVSNFMARRMIRNAVKAGRAPSALQARLSFHRAARK